MMTTPWGKAQTQRKLADGIVFYSTAGHGGIHVRADLNRLIPNYMRNTNGWYEEDCEYAIPTLIFKLENYGGAFESLKNWNPAIFERFFNLKLAPGESYIRDKELFEAANKDNFVVFSAIGENDVVHVYARKGDTEKRFIVPAEEYQTRGKYGFVIDESKHAELKEVSA
jgi:hypothetical protein